MGEQLQYESGFERAKAVHARRKLFWRKFAVIVIALFAFIFIGVAVLMKLFHISWGEPSMALTLTVGNHTSQPLIAVGLSDGYEQPEESVGPLSPGQSRQVKVDVLENYTPRGIRVIDAKGIFAGDVQDPEKAFPMNYDVQCTLDVFPGHVHFSSGNSLMGNISTDIPLVPYVEPPPTSPQPASNPSMASHK